MAVSFGLISSCDNSTGVYGIDVVFPDSAVDFTSHVQPFLKKNCAYSGCHSSITMAGGLSMEDYFSIMTFPGLIIPENPNSSILNQILEGVLPHGTIFYSGYITQNQIQGMRTWVLEGAKLIP
ncbi:MAG: hypothetical protein A2X64_03045 [Ignavibacteria bacterium GWF2_33_9]|nr:MAG: hypothetical protein A2X64_03045 [Ignavibacteria bacterium GWF2_33_9]